MMDYLDCIQKSLDYIEKHIDEDITLEKLATLSFCSKFHFHRLFKALVGMGVIEYLRKRRLSLAAHSLENSNNSIIEIAMNTGYNSHAAFTRAFKTLYKVSPEEYRKNQPPIQFFDKIDLRKRRLIDNRTGCVFGPRLFYKESFTVVGQQMSCTFEENLQTNAAPKLWEDFLENRFQLGEIKGYTGYGVTFDSELGKSFNYIASFELVSKCNPIPEGMVCYTVPSSLYASFLFKFDFDIQRFYDVLDYIYGVWLPNSNYTLSNELDLIEAVDFIRQLEGDMSYEIWIPLQNPKNPKSNNC